MGDIVALVALAAMALVGLDLALRPGRHVRRSAERVERGSAVPLEGLSHRLFPQFETARAYRVIGLFILIVAGAGAAYIRFKGA